MATQHPAWQLQAGAHRTTRRQVVQMASRMVVPLLADQPAPGLAFPAELRRLLAIASRELDRHVRDNRARCQVCHRAWPRERAQLAATTLNGL
jgi:hypothetical protein